MYIDDIFLASEDIKEIDRTKEQLKSRFETEDLGVAKKILGMDAACDRRKGTLFLSQQCYAEKELDKFGMINAKPVSTPLAQPFKLVLVRPNEEEEEAEKMKNVPYSML